jgi:hypothetical protein
VEAKNINVNATDDVFLVFIVVQQCSLVLQQEKEKVAVIAKAEFRLLKNNANKSS